eukprot:Nitzschia sp. Nitz4//scaffold47_size129522//21488//23464//NITZ4_003539-RA/size129522-processed-gene-0.4-mRNA-1//1//CDS//3329552764//9090//frame0
MSVSVASPTETFPAVKESLAPASDSESSNEEQRERASSPSDVPKAPFYYYKDYSQLPDPDPSKPVTAYGRIPNFPAKLFAILGRQDLVDIISWMPHGRSWKVHKPREFEAKVIPSYFDHGKFSSFIRQANGWGFKRLASKGSDRNSHYHELFLRGKPHLLKIMKRPGATNKPPQPSSPSNKKAKKNNTDPDFYKIAEEFPLPDPKGVPATLLVSPNVPTQVHTLPLQVGQSPAMAGISPGMSKHTLVLPRTEITQSLTPTLAPKPHVFQAPELPSLQPNGFSGSTSQENQQQQQQHHHHTALRRSSAPAVFHITQNDAHHQAWAGHESHSANPLPIQTRSLTPPGSGSNEGLHRTNSVPHTHGEPLVHNSNNNHLLDGDEVDPLHFFLQDVYSGNGHGHGQTHHPHHQITPPLEPQMAPSASTPSFHSQHMPSTNTITPQYQHHMHRSCSTPTVVSTSSLQHGQVLPPAPPQLVSSSSTSSMHKSSAPAASNQSLSHYCEETLVLPRSSSTPTALSGQHGQGNGHGHPILPKPLAPLAPSASTPTFHSPTSVRPQLVPEFHASSSSALHRSVSASVVGSNMRQQHTPTIYEYSSSSPSSSKSTLHTVATAPTSMYVAQQQAEEPHYLPSATSSDFPPTSGSPTYMETDDLFPNEVLFF